MENNKNLREKLQEARMLLKKESITKSGKNGFLKTNYYTLADIQTPITKVCATVRICPTITFTKEEARLTIYDFDSEETLVFTSPMIEIVKEEKKSMMQELGSYETYSRRFLYLSVFEISEDEEEPNDSLENHDVLMVKTRIEREMTELLKRGYDMKDIIEKIGMKNEDTYNRVLSACNTINTLENNMRVLLNDKSAK